MEIFNVLSKQQQQDVGTVLKESSVQSSRAVEKVEINTSTVKENEIKSMDEETIKNKLDEIVKKLNKHMDSLNTNIMFGYNDKINWMYVNVMERDSGKVIRKIPSDEAMKLSEKMQEIVGMIFDEKG
jgi:flagellar protein FlaG